MYLFLFKELKELMVHLVKPQHNLSSVDNLYTSIGNLFVDDYCAYFKIPQHSQLYTSYEIILYNIFRNCTYLINI